MVATTRLKRLYWGALNRSRSLRRRLGAARQAFSISPYTLEIGRFGGFEVAYRKATSDEDVLADSFDKDIFFSGVPEYRPEPGDTILDVGAHIGTFALLAASKVPQGHVHAIEACRETFHYLRINAALNRAGNIHPAHLALSDRAGTATLYYDTGNWGHSLVQTMTGYGETVATDSLANFLEARGIARCHFAKFNCEGAEFPILFGASAETLRKFDRLLVLYHCDLYRGRSERDLIEHLQSSGFATEVRNQTERRGWIVATADRGKSEREESSIGDVN